MGWWSCEIMGGDTPYGYVDMIVEMLEIEDNDEKELFEIDANLLTEHQEKIIKTFQKTEDIEDLQIALQVLAYIMMFNGAQIKNSCKIKMLEAVEEDEWAKTSQERQKEIFKFYSILEKYDGSESVELEHKGFLQTLPEKIDKKIAEDPFPGLEIEKEKEDLDL